MIRSASATLPYESRLPFPDRPLRRPMVSHLVRHRVRRSSALIARLTVPTESDRFLDLFGPSLDLNRSRLSVIRPGRPLIHPQTQVQVLHHCASPWVWILAFRLSSLLVPEQDVVHFQSSLAPGSHVPPYSQPSGSQPEPFITIPPLHAPGKPSSTL